MNDQRPTDCLEDERVPQWSFAHMVMFTYIYKNHQQPLTTSSNQMIKVLEELKTFDSADSFH